MAAQSHDFNPERVRRLARLHEGNARAHLERIGEGESPSGEQLQVERPSRPRQRWNQHEMLAASGFVIAGSWWSLVDASRAVACYRSASKLYLERGHNYWRPLALAAGLFVPVDDERTGNERVEMPPQEVAFAMMHEEMAAVESLPRDSSADANRLDDQKDWRSARRVDRLESQWRHAGNVPIGRLGIPLDHYVRCAHAVRGARLQQDEGGLAQCMDDYVRRAAEVIRGASHDTFHWSRLQTSILPAEPEAVAMMAAITMASRRLFGEVVPPRREFDQHAQLLIEVGGELERAARNVAEPDAQA